ncbi:MAG: ABC transporter permease [Fervidobacterium pennivorans]|uniref:ABC-type spermidine/putrescine transport system, permease component I n=1 Tax=Fervidobacterium pennivorans (strain DSM 9078 / Ven5) TaxID=771875 RepID=H9U9X8_FERPD|nr:MULTISPECIES: ABC transporter permease [Fervidobacterium]AFG34321.1 ABC-type spermidine/putrescine transport system, permease component I [Fervidobacterium pennivorans DSM 9078]
MSRKKHIRPLSRGYESYGLVYLLWLAVFFLIPVIVILTYSFFERDYQGGVIFKFSLQGYKDILNPNYVAVFLRTIFISLVSSVVSIILAIPVAYYIAFSRWKNILLLLVIVPFWTNSLIRIYAWIFILGNNGLVNQFLIKMGFTESYVQFIYNNFAVVLVLVYTYLPFAILPLYSAIERLEKNIFEAAMDLGCTKRQVFFRVLLPNIRQGIISAFVFVFIPAIGTYAVPELVGGKNSRLIGNEIARLLTTARNWPAAAAISSVLLAITIIAVIVFMFGGEKREAR